MKWKNYKIQYCGLCRTLTYECPVCHNGSCTGGGCPSCVPDFKEFCAWEKTPEGIKARYWLKFVDFWRRVNFIFLKWDGRSRRSKWLWWELFSFRTQIWKIRCWWKYDVLKQKMEKRT